MLSPNSIELLRRVSTLPAQVVSGIIEASLDPTWRLVITTGYRDEGARINTQLESQTPYRILLHNYLIRHKLW